MMILSWWILAWPLWLGVCFRYLTPSHWKWGFCGVCFRGVGLHFPKTYQNSTQMALPFGFPKMTWNCLSSNPFGCCFGVYWRIQPLVANGCFFVLQHKNTLKWYTLPTTGLQMKINGSIMKIIFGKAYSHCYVGFREGIHPMFSLYYQTFLRHLAAAISTQGHFINVQRPKPHGMNIFG